MTVDYQEREFEAQAADVLNLMIHSLYTQKDVFLRELISNASDALDRLRFEAISNPSLQPEGHRSEIRLEIDRAARTLVVSDTGIGMSRAEVIENIGTVAKSATRELKQAVAESAADGTTNGLIGQFGVGFYAAFMVADKVTLLTRRAGEDGATEWESDGKRTYVVRDATKPEAGTRITLQLKAVNEENGIEDFTEFWRVASIVRKHSDFIAYPILCRQEVEPANAGGGATFEDTTLNAMKPLWTRLPADVTAAEYNEFYKHLTHDWSEPLEVIHFRAEGTFEYDALLYVPARAPQDLYYVSPDVGLHLFAKRVEVMEKCQDLLPRYLRFVRGVVDAADSPLNISRQRLQQDYHVALIRKKLTRKILDALQSMFERDREKYVKLWREFGRALKEGMGTDRDNEGRLADLLLFESSRDADGLITLKEYVARMAPEQQEILYLTGESRYAIENAPQVEGVRAKGYEVLYLSDPVDELVVQHLPSFDGKKLRSVGKGTLEIDSEQPSAAEGDDQPDEAQEYHVLIELLKETLSAHVKEVRLSKRLTTSPACLVGENSDYSPQLERLLSAGPGSPGSRRILEVNPKHPLIASLRQRAANDSGDVVLKQAAEVLLGLALLSDGSKLHDPVRFNRATSDLLASVL